MKNKMSEEFKIKRIKKGKNGGAILKLKSSQIMKKLKNVIDIKNIEVRNLNKPGSVVLGMVKKISDLELGISLPHYQMGTVPAMAVSETYSDLVKTAVTDNELPENTLSTMFSHNQIVYVKIISREGKSFNLSMVPKHVHAAVKVSQLEKGSVFIGTVSEIQDDDYVIETGFKDLTAILLRGKSKKEYKMGDVVTLSVKKIEHSMFGPSIAKLKDVTGENELLVTGPPLPGGKVMVKMLERINNINIRGEMLGGKFKTLTLASSQTLEMGKSYKCTIICSHSNGYIIVLPDGSGKDVPEDLKIGPGSDVNFLVKEIKDDAIYGDIIGTRIRATLGHDDVMKSMIKLGSTIRGKVLRFNKSHGAHKFQITTRVEYLNPNAKILQAITDDVKVGSVFLGTVHQEFDKFYVVQFFNIFSATVRKVGHSELCIGMIREFEITFIKHDVATRHTKIYLKLAGTPIENDDEHLGRICRGVVTKHLINGVNVQIENNEAECAMLYGMAGKAISLKEGDEFECIDLGHEMYSVRDLDHFANNPIKSFDDIEENDILRGMVRHYSNNNYLEVYVPIKNYKKLFVFKYDELINEQPSEITFRYNQIIHLKVTEKSTNELKLCPKLSGIWSGFDDTLNSCIELLKTYSFSSRGINIGDVFTGKVTRVLSLSYGHSAQLSHDNIQAWINCNDVEPKVGDELSGIVAWINYTGTIHLVDKKIKEHKNKLEQYDTILAKTCLKKDSFAIAVGAGKKKYLLVVPKFLHHNDFIGEIDKHTLFEDATYVVLGYYGSFVIAIPEEYYKLHATPTLNRDKRKALDIDIVVTTKKSKKEKRSKLNDDDDKIENDIDMSLLPAVTNFWSENLQSINQPLSLKSQIDPDDDNSDTEIVKQTKKKLTPAEKREQFKKEEARIRNIEETLAKSNVEPETADHFDRLVLATPNDSLIWIKYMAFHLQSAEIEKARNIGHLALKKISFRDEDEKLNVWVALLNLEIRYGNSESFSQVFEDAVKVNDPFKVYAKCLEIYVATNMKDEANNLILKMIKKFKANLEMWIKVATTYFELDEGEKAKKLMNRSLTSLADKDHVKVLTQFALLYNRFNETENAHSLLEQILAAYPKRVDIWSVYIDMLTKANEIVLVRHTLDRAITQKLPVKKMRSLFKKYLEFEKKYGTDESVAKVKSMAEDFVINKIGVDGKDDN